MFLIHSVEKATDIVLRTWHSRAASYDNVS